MTKKDFLYPLRRLHGLIHEWNANRISAKRIAKTITQNTVWILATPDHTNIGDSAIVLAELSFLHRCGLPTAATTELTHNECKQLFVHLRRHISRSKFICWHGGGNMGNQWMHEEFLRRDLMCQLRNVSSLIMPQTIFYTADEYGQQTQAQSVAVYNRKSLSIAARESESFRIMSSLYPEANIIYTPDIVLSCTMSDFGVQPRERNDILLCMRSDAERAMTDEQRQAVENLVSALDMPFKYTDMYSDCRVTKENRSECVRKKMDEFAGARLVITDRLHGMIFAAITGTPCIAFGNYNHKVKGTYEWISYLPYIRYVESVEEAGEVLPKLLAMKDCHYDNTPLLPHFEKLAQVVKDHAHN